MLELRQNSFLMTSIWVSIAIFFAGITTHFFSFTASNWIILTVFLIIQVVNIMVLRLSFLMALTILFAVFLGSLMLIIKNSIIFYPAVVFSYLLICGFAFFIRNFSKTYFELLIAFLVILTIVIFFPQDALHDQVLDIFIGTIIAILCICPTFLRFDKTFRHDLIPLLKTLVNSSRAMSYYLDAQHKNAEMITQYTTQIEKVLVSNYPEWVYEAGFNRGLRAGFRFFLIHLEQVTEIIFSLNYAILYQLPNDLQAQFAKQLSNVINKNGELISTLLTYCESKQLKNTNSDFTSDMVELENALRTAIPANLELLDTSTSYIALAAIGRDLKDMRSLLLQLIVALPENKLNL